MNITFIGNCQTVSLCFYFQQLLKEYNICWLLYNEDFKIHLGNWSEKCKNKIVDENISIQHVENSDIIIYQVIENTIFNTCNLLKYKKDSCKLIKIPSIYLIYEDFDNSINNLIEREIKNNVDVKVSNIFLLFKNTNLMLSCNHPTTFLFMEIIKQLCLFINIDFFKEEQYNIFLKNENYMELP
jgi:hypothetical protein